MCVRGARTCRPMNHLLRFGCVISDDKRKVLIFRAVENVFRMFGLECFSTFRDFHTFSMDSRSVLNRLDFASAFHDSDVYK